MSFFSKTFFLTGFFLFLSVTPVLAEFNPTNTASYGGLAIKDSLGAISSTDSAMILAVNFLVYVGWAGVIIGILAVLGLLIFKLVGTEDTDTLKEVQGGIVKALIIALIGLLILSAGFFVKLSGNIVGEDNVELGL